MKRMKKIASLLLAVVMVLGMSMTVFATNEEHGTPNQEHTITISNTDQNVSHKYEAYQIFVGNLDAKENTLSDIKWGNGINAVGLITALQGTTESELADVKTAVSSVNVNDSESVEGAAQIVAKAIEGFDSTTEVNVPAGAIDAFASIIAENLGAKANGGDFVEGDDGAYTATVVGDGYYFIKDVTEDDDLNGGAGGSDTRSKYLLSVVKNTTIIAKDTGLVPDKNILIANGEDPTGFIRLKDGTAAIGDEVTFEAKATVPNTVKYEKGFWFIMNDQLQPGFTFMEIKSIKIGDDDFTNYELTVKTGEGAYGTYTKPTTTEEAVKAVGGQAIRVNFKGFKSFVEDNNAIGKDVVITYTAVVNDDTTYGATGVENEVSFDYSNNPNHDYDGDWTPDKNDPMGTTPESKTRTYVTSLEIFKYHDNMEALPGAEFEITGQAFNIVLETGERFVVDANGAYWKLKDGSYTTQDPTAEGMNNTQYEDVDTKYRLETYEKEVKTPVDYKVTVISDANGKINIKGLKPGTYTIKETKAPDGYNNSDEEYTLVIDWANPNAEGADSSLKKSGGFSLGTSSTEGWSMTEDGVTFGINIENQSGSLLPSTGGIGTTIFYVVGGILVIGAGILLVAKKRMSNR